MRYLALFFLLAACGDPFEPSAPYHEFVPPPEFRNWWIETETCSRRSGNFELISWFVFETNGISFEGHLANGMWAKPHRIWFVPIVLDTALTSEWIRKHIVKHEMLHDLIQSGGHPPVFEQCDPLGVAAGSRSYR